MLVQFLLKLLCIQQRIAKQAKFIMPVLVRNINKAPAWELYLRLMRTIDKLIAAFYRAQCSMDKQSNAVELTKALIKMAQLIEVQTALLRHVVILFKSSSVGLN
ncbi:uncharacterized protein LOC117135041 [Drosophila busckii]|uniref:uncharacterized protein LOC117135041 n=1 Tax=Drosophila busckii TaxID=30019 RepID=UPI0014333BBE|nr:uncharacterized protein LOC117135041 [Drosophila busckii]